MCGCASMLVLHISCVAVGRLDSSDILRYCTVKQQIRITTHPCPNLYFSINFVAVGFGDTFREKLLGLLVC